MLAMCPSPPYIPHSAQQAAYDLGFRLSDCSHTPLPSDFPVAVRLAYTAGRIAAQTQARAA